MRTIEGMENYLKPLDDAVSNFLLPNLLGLVVNDEDLKLFSLPVKHGGLGISNFVEKSSLDYEYSKIMTAPLVAIMAMQSNDLPNAYLVKEKRSTIKSIKAQKLKGKISKVEASLPSETLRVVQQTREYNQRGLDIRARGFWRPAQNNFFDVRITNPSSASSRNSTIEKILNEHEKEKKRAYNHCVMEVEHGTFTPLIFTIHGSTSTECTIFHNNLAEKIANKTGEEYSKVLILIRCKIFFLNFESCPPVSQRK